MNKRLLVFIPLFLLLVFLFSTRSVKAAPSNNPIFASIDKVQQMIATALVPVQNSIQELSNKVRILEATVTPTPGQIAVAKKLKVYDANNQELGILESLDLGQSTVYSTTSGEIIRISSLNGVPLIGFQTEEFYTSSDCSGTAYISNSDIADKWLFYVRGSNMLVDNSTSPQTLTIHSESNSQICEQNDNFQELDLRPLVLSSYPYNNPVAFPLQYKFQ